MSRVYDKTLFDHMVQDLSIPLPLAQKSAEGILAIIQEGLMRDGVVNVTNFGTFRLKPVAARVGFNPNTRERIEIPAHHRVVFTPAKTLRDQAAPPRQPSVPIQTESNDETALNVPVGAVEMTESLQPVVIDAHIAEVPIAEPEQTPGGDASVQCTISSLPTPAPQPIPEQPPEHSIIAAAESARAPREHAMPSAQDGPENGPQTRAFQHRNHASASTNRHHFLGVAAVLLLGLYVFFKLQDTASDLLMAKQTSVGEASPVQAAAIGGAPAAPIVQAPHLYFEEQTLEIVRGDSLWSLAQRHYRDAYLWPHIYRANASSIENPDYLAEHQAITIPSLEGSPESLSENDRRNIARGYYLVYQFYKNADRDDAVPALRVARRYDANVAEVHP